MANKTLAKRQKPSFRVEPSQKPLRTPRTPVTLAARHGRDTAVERQAQQRLPRKKAAGDDR